MRVAELMEELEYLAEQYPDAEVRLAIQPSWPFEHSVAQVYAADANGGREPAPDPQDYEVEADYDEDYAEWQAGIDEREAEMVVYLAEGGQIGYLPADAQQQAGW